MTCKAAALTFKQMPRLWYEAIKASDIAKGLTFRWAERPIRNIWRQDSDRSRYLLQPFLSYAFVCIYLEQRRHKSDKNNKGKTEQDTKWGWDSFAGACLSLSTSPWQSIPGGFCPRKWHASQVWILHAAAVCSSEQKERGYRWRISDLYAAWMCFLKNPKNLEQACAERPPDNTP